MREYEKVRRAIEVPDGEFTKTTGYRCRGNKPADSRYIEQSQADYDINSPLR